MGWAVGYDDKWDRDIGYGVPAFCDHKGCGVKIDRGLSYVCGGEPYGGSFGCGLFFCGRHMKYRTPRGEKKEYQNCSRCMRYEQPFQCTPEHPEWVEHKLKDESWQAWRDDHPDWVERARKALALNDAGYKWDFRNST